MKQNEIEELLKFFDTTELSKLKIKDGNGFEIEIEKKISKQSVENEPVSIPQACPPINLNLTTNASASDKPKDTINSPMVGTFYQAPNPGAKAFVKVGQNVKKGEVVAIIEAMKIMNEIEAEFDCRITEVLVSDGSPVEYAMPLFAVEKL